MTRERSGALQRMLDAAVARLASSRRTFTDEEALAAVWEAGYEVSPQSDERFVLAREADGRSPRHWRLAGQVVANNRLLEVLVEGSWDGRDLDAELVRLSAAEGAPHIFCPIDPRFELRDDGALEVAEQERAVVLPALVRDELSGLLTRLVEQWKAKGLSPWTVRQVTASIRELGWARATERGAWQLVRAWLLELPAVRRVGADYWVLAEAMPAGPARTRLSVVPVVGLPADCADADTEVASSEGEQRPEPGRGRGGTEMVPTAAGSLETRWTVTLRTVHLVEGFLPVPAPCRQAYPPRARQAGDWEVMRGRWFDTGEELWVWLDRRRDLLCGPHLCDRLAWCEAGEKLSVLWSADVIVFRSAGIDEVAQREEARLADRDALNEMRGGLGESYRQSLLVILREAPGGLLFPELLARLCERQQHEIHRGTVRALLSASGFLCRGKRWFVAEGEGGRRLCRAFAESLCGGDEKRAPLRQLAGAVNDRLRAILRGL